LQKQTSIGLPVWFVLSLPFIIAALSFFDGAFRIIFGFIRDIIMIISPVELLPFFLRTEAILFIATVFHQI
jgi:hypothetical protein